MIQRFQNTDTLKGLLVFSPLALSASSFIIGLKIGLFATVAVLLLSIIVFFSRNFFSLALQRLTFVLFTSITLMLMLRMFVQAEAYELSEQIGLFLPLLLMNSFIFSVNESIFERSNFKTALSHVLIAAITILIFFIIFGFFQQFLNEISIFASPVGFFFLFGFLLAIGNILNTKRLS